MATQAIPTWNNTHRLFVQALMSHRMLTEDQGLGIYRDICEMTEVTPMDDFSEFLGIVGHRLHDIDMTIKRTQHQLTGVTLLALVNTNADDIAQMATAHDVNEIHYFRTLISKIVTADNDSYSIRSIAALQLGQREMKPPMSQNTTESLLEQFVKEGWLEEVDGQYILSARTLMELGGYLADEYPEEINECIVCQHVITAGERCKNLDCQVRMHRHCSEQRFVRNRVVMKCPTCSTAWLRSNTFGAGL
ncbi:hypothetical protein DM01DRAFT_267088 [Hesseltinella vesiculosa]|uniref:Non-structural maintenance of chromosomes element 1 homolog n=1 Tax=Hesseltinella vesiculosa TaxID=101127 RepID=A0A1X2G7L3_9FUNG|nr:hypothetical protein DM01DRAFT_267088 [Hesseltinella vesiculosa]